MLILEFTFPGGRYHATPWGRNVNEGEVEWPPSPFRLSRALMDACKRRRPDWDDARLERILRILVASPSFVLPPATVSHTRSYLSSNDWDPSEKQKIFDAFVVLGDAPLLMGLNADPDPETRSDLAELLGELNYLGRSESWVVARILEDGVPLPSFNSTPVEESPTREEGKGWKRVKVACLRSPEDYYDLPKLPTLPGTKKKPGAPRSWLEALAMSSQELLNDGWSAPPALRYAHYWLPENAFQGQARKRRTKPRSTFRVARFALDSPVLPRITDTVSFAERIRAKLMGIHKRQMGNDPGAVSPVFSGKGENTEAATGHRHAYILPLDEDRDGRLDHLLVCAAQPFTPDELYALDRLRSTWQPDNRPDVRLVLTTLLNDAPLETSQGWVSTTPIVLARHYRKGRGDYAEWLKGEIRKECSFHNLPEPESIELIDRTQAAHSIRWQEFLRSRKGQRPSPGHGCILRFSEPVRGPFAIGALAHFGLGQFVPLSDGRHEQDS